MPPVWLLFVLASGLWLYYLVRPLVERSTPADDPRRRLLEEKRGYLYALRDAEADYRAGKLSETDYESVRDRLEARAAATIRSLEELEGGSTAGRIEARLGQLRDGGS